MELKKKIAKLPGKTNPERTPKEKRFFKVYEWMLRLPLTGYEKLVLAFIHGYTQQNKGYCYRAEVLGGKVFSMSAETIESVMQSLVAKGYLIKDNKGLYWTNKK